MCQNHWHSFLFEILDVSTTIDRIFYWIFVYFILKIKWIYFQGKILDFQISNTNFFIKILNNPYAIFSPYDNIIQFVAMYITEIVRWFWNDGMTKRNIMIFLEIVFFVYSVKTNFSSSVRAKTFKWILRLRELSSIEIQCFGWMENILKSFKAGKSP